MTDGAVIARVREGERDAFAFLVRRYQDEFFRFARGMGMDYDTASDLVQDTFVRAYIRLDDCDKPDRFRYWALSILRNRCLDHLKDVRRRTLPLDDVETLDATRLATDPADELRVVLGLAFARLPEPLREAFLLKHQAGYSYDEMAEITGASVSALKMRVLRARAALQERFAGTSATAS